MADIKGEREKRRTLTVLVPCYNEQETLPILFERMSNLIDSKPKGLVLSLLFVDDGSKDDTRTLIRQYASTHSYVRYIFLSRNFGKEKAMLAGIHHTDTDGLVIMDADLQDPPELIPEMAKYWFEGYEDVYARRRSRKGESWAKKFTSRMYYRILQKVSRISIQEDTGDFRLLDRRCVDALKRLNESERNSKALFSWIGFRKYEFLYDRDARAAGSSKWKLGRLIRLALDGITSFTTAPLKLATWVGLGVSLLAIVYALVILFRTLAMGVDLPGYASTMIAILLLGGLQLLSLGIIGEYLGRVFMQTKNRPNYLIEESNLEDMQSNHPAQTRPHD
ncbi:glycosyltransferase family 2 protein [Bifidobacterium mellis]|uniref:Glycosyltransferase n=1 Tax=Bifidobacterium mellis TaxID=1293823 RepID=A0A0F4KVR3_9BIFI|nr:glycosyltransferase family 2 protein [Bifidobacterium mellis]KJY50742.1 Glycosyltransferase [Bifidobacterium mellis]